MRIIHTGDIHLESPLDSALPTEKAVVRRNELLKTFEKLVTFAIDNFAEVIIIAGDFFDCENVSRKTCQFVFDKIKSAENIDFLYLKGNHDENITFKIDIPENLKILDKNFEKYNYDNVSIGLINPLVNNYDDVIFDANSYNVAVMHGSVSGEYGNYLVNLPALKNKNIDYLALGHIHKGGCGKIDDRGFYNYCGILDGRGFGEYGEKGFYLIDTQKQNYEFIKMSSRVCYEVDVDISDTLSNAQIKDRIEEATKNIDQKSIVRVNLTGKYNEKLIKDISFLEQCFNERFFYVSIKDNSTLNIDYNSYKNDISLKGEFIRLCMQSDLTENIRNKVITAGINALENEEINL